LLLEIQVQIRFDEFVHGAVGHFYLERRSRQKDTGEKATKRANGVERLLLAPFFVSFSPAHKKATFWQQHFGKQIKQKI